MDTNIAYGLMLVTLGFFGYIGYQAATKKELNADEYADSIIEVMDNIGVDAFHFLGQHGGASIGINLEQYFINQGSSSIIFLKS